MKAALTLLLLLLVLLFCTSFQYINVSPKSVMPEETGKIIYCPKFEAMGPIDGVYGIIVGLDTIIIPIRVDCDLKLKRASNYEL